jgi:hypothetical protein
LCIVVNPIPARNREHRQLRWRKRVDHATDRFYGCRSQIPMGPSHEEGKPHNLSNHKAPRAAGNVEDRSGDATGSIRGSHVMPNSPCMGRSSR